MRAEAESAIARVRDLEGDWQAFHLLEHDVINGVHEHLNQAHAMLSRVRDMAATEASRLKGAA
jgi:hypothetical protein